MIRVPCETCHGSGDRALHHHEVDTLSAVGSEWCSTSAIAPRISIPEKIGISALCNRLVRLESRGLVERRNTNGKDLEWRLTRAAKGQIRDAITTARKAG